MTEPQSANASSAGQPPAGGTLAFMTRALRYRNYRLFFAGQLVSLIGTWLSMVATSWLVYRLAHQEMPRREALVLGLVGFASQIPVFLCSPFAGVWIDRWPRHRILIATQTSSMLQSFALAGLAYSGVIAIWQIVALNLLQGFVNAFDLPARQAFVVEMVEDRRDLSNAIALSSSMVHASRLLGPSLAGVLIYWVGEAVCFFIDGVSYLAVLLALLAMRVRPFRPPQGAGSAWRSFVEGVRYAVRFRPIVALLSMVAVTSLMTMSQATLMPIYAAEVLGGNERTLGLLLAASGLGALIGSLYLASRRTVLGLGRVIALGAIALGLALILLGLVRHLTSALPLLLVAGTSMVVLMASCNTLLQTIVDDDKRGRVMSLFAMAFMGMTPFGSLLAGTLASAIGAPATLAIAGGICAIAGLIFLRNLPWLRALIRPIYVERGVLPELALGLQATSDAARIGEE